MTCQIIAASKCLKAVWLLKTFILLRKSQLQSLPSQLPCGMKDPEAGSVTYLGRQQAAG